MGLADLEDAWEGSAMKTTMKTTSMIAALALGLVPMPQGAAPFPSTAIRSQCIEFDGVRQGSGPGDYRECRVSESGELGRVGNQVLHYTLYCLMPTYTRADATCAGDSFEARYHRARALAVFAGESSGDNVRLLFERAEPEIGTIYYAKPEIVRHGADTLLHLPIAVDGTGHGNASEYYLRRADAWERIESEQWLNDLQGQLPKGLEIWHGVWPDLSTMTAEVSLSRPGDANCCPSGGVARLRLAIRARQFVIVSVAFEKNPPDPTEGVSANRDREHPTALRDRELTTPVPWFPPLDRPARAGGRERAPALARRRFSRGARAFRRAPEWAGRGQAPPGWPKSIAAAT
jgi:hypothetical protein